MNLLHALQLTPNALVAFVGAGGKTTAMFKLADDIVASGGKVITTTTTKLAAHQTQLAPCQVTSLDQLASALPTHAHVLFTGEVDSQTQKTTPLSESLISNLQSLISNHYLLIEADGSRHLPLKAPAAHEPVIPNFVTHVVIVVGIDALGKPLTDEFVHRAEVVAQLAETRVGIKANAELIAKVLTHPRGGLKNVPSNARVSVLINKVVNEKDFAEARVIAKLIQGQRLKIDILIGEAHSEIKEVWTSVACVVLAAGESKRMGTLKQLLKWQETTLVNHVTQIALASEANEVLVITGAGAEQVAQAVEGLRVRTVFNARYQAGQSEAVKAAVAAAPDHQSLIFLLVDQPNISSDLINALIQKHRETLAPVIVTRVNGKRANPVLFARATWGDLKNLTGDTGGRALFERYPLTYVDWNDSVLGEADTPEEYAALVVKSF